MTDNAHYSTVCSMVAPLAEQNSPSAEQDSPTAEQDSASTEQNKNSAPLAWKPVC